MLSKNNRQLTNRMNAKQHQRFGLRKLTVGVASVLLGTTFFFGGAAHAETTVAEQNNDSTVSTSRPVASNEQATGKTENNSNNGQEQRLTLSQPQDQPASGAAAAQQSAVVAHDEQRSQSSTNDTATVSGLTFTGSVNDFKNTTAGKAPTDTSFKAGDTADLTYTMRGSGDTSKLQNNYWPVTSRYLVMLPAGFQLASGNNSSWETSFPTSDYHLTSLGQVGPDGEYVYLITLDKTPYYGMPVAFTAHMVVSSTTDTAGSHDYQGFPIPGLLMALNDNGLFVGQHAVTLGTQTYQVSNCSGFLHGNSLGAEIKYTVIPGVNQLAANNYQVTSVTSTKQNGEGVGNAGYEEITPTIKIIGDVHAGDYIDFHLGIPYTDSQNNQPAYELYDSHLSANFTVNNIGTVYNMGNYYRLVFNDAATSLNHPTFNLHLRWGSSNNQASLNKDDSIYVYRPTNDPEQDRTTFTYQPTNDVTINGQTRASGLSVKGVYVYVDQPVATGNQNIGASAIPSVNRTWNQQGDVSISTHWSDTQSASLSTVASGNDFELKTTVTKDPHGLVHYTFATADEMKRAIENNIATVDTHRLTNAVQDDNGTFVHLETVKGQKPPVNVAVTMTTTTDNNDPNKVTAIWHIKLANVDPASHTKIMLTGAVPTVIASADNFTMPTGITSYQQDTSEEVHTATYSGAKTSNEELMNVLKDLPVALTQVVSYKNNQPDKYSGVFGGQWNSQINYVGNSRVVGGGSATDLITATIMIKDSDGHSLIPTALTCQGATGTEIQFTGLQSAYNALSGYHFVKAVSEKDGVETPLNDLDLTRLDSDSFGTANKNNPRQFIIYLQRDQSQQTAALNFVDDTDATNDLSSHNLSAQGNEGSEISFTNLEQTLKALTDQHYVLSKVTGTSGETISGSEPQNIDWGTIFGKYGHDAASFTIHLKHGSEATSDAKTVSETIHYVYADGTTAADDHTASVDFKRTGTKDLVTNKTTWHPWTPADTYQFAAVESPELTGYTPSDLKIPAVTVEPTSDKVTKTVTYYGDTQKLTVRFIDDTENGKVLKTVTKTGTSNTDAGYNTRDDLQAYENQHYVLVSDNTDGQPLKFDDQNAVDQQYEVHLKHGTQPAKDVKTVTETVHYVYADGTPAAPDKVLTVQFRRTGTTDLVTSQTTWDAWTPTDDQFASIQSPWISGYTPDKIAVASATVNPLSSNLEETVTYTADQSPVEPTTKKQSGTSTPAKSIKEQGPSRLTSTTTVQQPAKVAQRRNQQKLPQTGNHESASLAVLGFAGLLGFFGLGKKLRKRH